MNKQRIFISVLMFIMFSTQIYIQKAHSDSTDQLELKTILKKCADYCERISKSSLFFVCKEKVKEIAYHPILGDTNVYVYDYQLIRKNKRITEKRILIEENGVKRHEKYAQLKTKFFYHKNIIFGPYGLLSEFWQQHYDYKIIKEDKFKGEDTLVIEAFPNSIQVKNDPYGKIWVRKNDFSIVKIQWNQKSIENYQVTESIARILGADPWISIVAIYDFEKNGIRFPSEFSITEVYISQRSLRRSLRSKTIVTYNDYKFFIVETEVTY